MNKRIFLVALSVLLVVLVAVSIAGAQTSTSFDLSWYVMAGGGERAEGTSYALNSTLGQPVSGLSADTNYALQSGYWYGVLSLSRHKVYLPLVLRDYP